MRKGICGTHVAMQYEVGWSSVQGSLRARYLSTYGATGSSSEMTFASARRITATAEVILVAEPIGISVSLVNRLVTGCA